MATCEAMTRRASVDYDSNACTILAQTVAQSSQLRCVTSLFPDGGIDIVEVVRSKTQTGAPSVRFDATSMNDPPQVTFEHRLSPSSRLPRIAYDPEKSLLETP